MSDDRRSVPSVSVSSARNGSTTEANALGVLGKTKRARG